MRTIRSSIARSIFGALTIAALAGQAVALPIFSGIAGFGDSLSDVGRFYAATGNTLPPPPYHDGRFCNGPVWIEHLADLIDTDLHPDDQYAIGGATTSDLNFNSMPGFILPGLEQQIDEAIADSGHCRLDPRALYSLWVGSNDVFVWLQSGSSDPTPLITNGVANTVDAIERLARRGARRFLVVNLPDLGKTPAAGALPPGVDLLLTDLCMSYNLLLDSELDRLERCRRIQIARLDSFGLINDMVSHPENYGFTNVAAPALFLLPGADPDEFLFWDEVHPTTVAQQAVAEAALAALEERFGRQRKPSIRSKVPRFRSRVPVSFHRRR